MKKNTGKDAFDIFQAAVASVDPARLLQHHLKIDEEYLYISNKKIDRQGINKLILIAVGKAAPAMAQEASIILGNYITTGICITKYKHGISLKNILLLEAGHPVPDHNSLKAGKKITTLLEGLNNRDMVLVLLSGGASALIEDLPEGIQLKDLQKLTEKLIKCGAGIHEINTVRKQISKLKGGGMSKAAFPASVYTLILSDVVGDNIDVIASGPTVTNNSTPTDAVAIIRRYDLWNHLSPAIQFYFEHKLKEPDRRKEAVFQKCFPFIIGSNKIALQAALHKARSLRYVSSILREDAVDNTEALATATVNYGNQYRGKLPACFLIGGETTLQVKGAGKGGAQSAFCIMCIRGDAQIFRIKK